MKLFKILILSFLLLLITDVISKRNMRKKRKTHNNFKKIRDCIVSKLSLSTFRHKNSAFENLSNDSIKKLKDLSDEEVKMNLLKEIIDNLGSKLKEPANSFINSFWNDCLKAK